MQSSVESLYNMVIYSKTFSKTYIDGLMQDCSISSALEIGILQSCNKSTWSIFFFQNLICILYLSLPLPIWLLTCWIFLKIIKDVCTFSIISFIQQKKTKFTIEQTYMLPILYWQYHACWCSGDFRSQGIGRHGIDPQSQNIPSPSSEELISSYVKLYFEEVWLYYVLVCLWFSHCYSWCDTILYENVFCHACLIFYFLFIFYVLIEHFFATVA